MYAEHWLGRCYLKQAKLKQAKKTDDDKQKADEYFEQARSHFQKRLDLAEKLENKQEQINAKSWLGSCYFRQGKYDNYLFVKKRLLR